MRVINHQNNCGCCDYGCCECGCSCCGCYFFHWAWLWREIKLWPLQNLNINELNCGWTNPKIQSEKWVFIIYFVVDFLKSSISGILREEGRGDYCMKKKIVTRNNEKVFSFMNAILSSFIKESVRLKIEKIFGFT